MVSIMSDSNSSSSSISLSELDLLQTGDFGYEIYKCSACTLRLELPIYKCERNHGICDHCYTYAETCRICDKKILCKRSSSLENLIREAKYPCWFKYGGCPFEGSSEELIAHEDGCIRNELKLCIFSLSELKCEWNGQGDKELPHCLNEHNQQTFLTKEIWLTVCKERHSFLVLAKDALFFGQILQDNENLTFNCSISYKTPFIGNTVKAKLEISGPYSIKKVSYTFLCDLVADFTQFYCDGDHLSISELEILHLKGDYGYDVAIEILLE